ncbi:MAG TPA: hypothetical protein VE195_00360 [Acidobacteriaceae bacterium]|nr:hypothetical protein [Acidobacteriaceae bacterium]
MWPSEPPAGIPFAASKDFTGIEFTGRYAHYGNADTWFPTWAVNGNLYSSWTDGTVNGVASSSLGPKATTGYATILGDDPLHLTITNVGTYAASPLPYGGRYPAGGLVYDGVWYYGTYLLDQTPGKGLNWDILGPFVGFRYSTDFGKTWYRSPHGPRHPLFDEPAEKDGPVKLGLPHIVDFGKNMEYSPDGKAYIVSQGATATDPNPRDANLSWITGDQIYMARVKPSIANMNRRSAYEYFAGHDRHGHARWTRHFSRIEPLIDWNNHTGNVSVTYDAPLKTYLMAVTDGGNTIGKYNTYILESPQITGPWRLVVYMRNFGEQAYFVNFPSKFISKDGRTLWMSYSANFTNGYLHNGMKSDPAGSGYWWTLQEVKLLGPGPEKRP